MRPVSQVLQQAAQMLQLAGQGSLLVGPCWQRQQLRLQPVVWVPWAVLLLQPVV
jgi:hypothetical protein